MGLSKTGLPLCPTCNRLKSQHTNPLSHQFGEPYKAAGLSASCLVSGCQREREYRSGLCHHHYKKARIAGPGDHSPKNKIRLPPPNRRPFPHPVLEDVAVVPLTRGKSAMIDRADAEAVGNHFWHLTRHKPRSDREYAATNRLFGDNRTERSFLHRFLWELWGLPETPFVDHENLDGLDCRRMNLRAATSTQNACNRPRQKNNTSGYKGVTKHEGAGATHWRASIRVDGMIIRLGTFTSAAEASAAYQEAARKCHGRFARF